MLSESCGGMIVLLGYAVQDDDGVHLTLDAVGGGGEWERTQTQIV